MVLLTRCEVTINRDEPLFASEGGGEATANVYRFSSKELMTRSGFYCYGFRFYVSLRQECATGLGVRASVVSGVVATPYRSGRGGGMTLGHETNPPVPDVPPLPHQGPSGSHLNN